MLRRRVRQGEFVKSEIKGLIKVLDSNHQVIYGKILDAHENTVKFFTTKPLSVKKKYKFRFCLPNYKGISNGHIICLPNTNFMNELGYLYGLRFFDLNYISIQRIRTHISQYEYLEIIII